MSGLSNITRALCIIVPAACVMTGSILNHVHSDDLKGVWITTDHEAIVEVYKKNELYYGRVLWLAKPLDKKGNPKRDHRNRNSKLKGRPLIGMNTLYNLKFNPSKLHWEGKVYVPLVGLEARAVITLKDKNTMRIRGYYGSMRKTQIWTRAKKSKNVKV